jgi:hypothetical protein
MVAPQAQAKEIKMHYITFNLMHIAIKVKFGCGGKFSSCSQESTNEIASPGIDISSLRQAGAQAVFQAFFGFHFP